MGYAPRLWRLSAVLGLGVFAAHTVLGSRMGADDFFNRYLYNALILLALAACLHRARQPGHERGAWIALSVGVASWSVAELIFDFAYGGSPPYPSVADAFYLGFYPACYVGLMLLVRSRLSAFGRTLWLDGVMAAIGSAALGAAVLFEVVLRSTDGSTGVIVTNLAYPLGDILLLSAVVGVFVLLGWKLDLTWGLIGAGLAATAVADAIFLFQTATSTYSEGTLLDALWPASMLLFAAAAWQPVTRADVALEGRPLLATPAVCGLIGLGILTYDHFERLNVLAVSLAGATIVAVIVRTAMTFGENAQILGLMRVHAATDYLTSLGNRRMLVEELDRVLEAGAAAEPRLLTIYDLNGFKSYNDTFGHLAGDALLARLAASLDVVAAQFGSAYRLGGDEFCVLARVPATGVEAYLHATVTALSESGDGFAITSSFGAVFLPDEATTPSDALRLADQRLYVQKRESTGRQAPHEVLLEALYERSPELRDHVEYVVASAVAVGKALGMKGAELEELRLAARLHDIGKLAMPDGVLQKPGPLDVGEWAFIKEHTVIGERLLAAAPGWGNVANIVRATHERWDGGGYRDGLAGGEIPLAARIIAVCDAYSAMTSQRPYRLPISREEALGELRRCAGTQFDADVVAAFCTVAQLPADAAWSPTPVYDYFRSATISAAARSPDSTGPFR
jgi:two-component system, cell cycle response regulator